MEKKLSEGQLAVEVEEKVAEKHQKKERLETSFWPPYQKTHLESLEERLREQKDFKNQDLSGKEKLILAAIVNDKIHNAYYREWIREKGEALRLVVRLSRRLVSVQKVPEEKTSQKEKEVEK